MKTNRLLGPIGIVQALPGIRVIWRMVRTSGGERITPVARNVGATLAVARSTSHLTSEQSSSGKDQVSVIIPVLNERTRLEPCLDGLISQGREVAEIIVVDGGSDDGTQELVNTYTWSDSRMCLVDASPIPPDWNGKA